MILNVYAVRDLMAGYLQPTLDINDEVAARNFKYAITKPDTLEFSNIQDFDLVCIGTYDNDLGIISGTPERIVVKGSSLLRGDNNA